jgi:SAM-dependent methyltransferase
MAPYSTDHWQKRVPKYLESAWSNGPTPFAQLSKAYFAPKGRILELGTGAGQDGLWFAEQGFVCTLTDGGDFGFIEIKRRADDKKVAVDLTVLDITELFPLDDGTFDAVYAQLVLHYFDDAMQDQIMSEIRRVLKPGGVLACMVNSVNDPEHDKTQVDDQGLQRVGMLVKRYFTLETFQPFTTGFATLLYDDKGRTPKDDSVETSGMIQFIGRRV